MINYLVSLSGINTIGLVLLILLILFMLAVLKYEETWKDFIIGLLVVSFLVGWAWLAVSLLYHEPEPHIAMPPEVRLQHAILEI